MNTNTKQLVAFISLIICAFSPRLEAQFSMSTTYTTGDIPTSFSSYDPGCNGAATPLDVILPVGVTINVVSMDVSYTMTASNPAWMSDQRSRLVCSTTSNAEVAVSAGVGNSAGTYSYSRTGLDIANGTYAGEAALSFHLQAWRTFATAASGCNTTANKVDDDSWTVTIHYDIDFDGDGFFAGIDDCDDFDAAVYPGSTEICDGIDNDCDGDIDEGLSSTTLTWSGAIDNNWDNIGNWTPNAVPDYCTDVIITDGSDVQIIFPAYARTIILEENTTLTNLESLEVGNDPSINYAIDNFGLLDNSDGMITIGNVGQGLLNRFDGSVQLGSMSFIGNNNRSIINEGVITANGTSYLEINGSTGISNNGNMTIDNLIIDNDPSIQVVVNDAVLTFADCGISEINGTVANNGTLTNNGFLTWNANIGSSNTLNFVNNGFLKNDDGTILSLLTAHDGWGLEEVNALTCYSDPVGPVFSGTGTGLFIVSDQIYLNDYSTVAGTYDHTTNEITFNSDAIGNANFIIEIENTIDFCSEYFELNLSNPILAQSTYYRDADGDGYGNAMNSVNTCSVPNGYVLDNSDCDDTDSTIYPGANELCDGLDNNCDGQIDESAALETNVFSETINNLWEEPGNWSQGILPTSCHDVIISATATCSNNSFIEVASITNHGSLSLQGGGLFIFNSGNAITNTGMLNIIDGWYTFASIPGRVLQNQGNAFIGGPVTMDAANGFDMSDYMLYCSGSSSMTNDGMWLFPAAGGGNNGYGIFIEQLSSFTNSPTGRMYLDANTIIPEGLLTNQGCICTGDCMTACP